jgi:hypothetical protein
MKCRKKPEFFDVTQWFENGDHPKDYADSVEGFENGELVSFSAEHQKKLKWEGQVVRYYRSPDIDGLVTCKQCARIMHLHGWLDTLDGGQHVCPGDFIKTGANGNYLRITPATFDKFYEQVFKKGGLA